MPSKTPKQAKLMAAAAHNQKFAKKVNVPQKVAKEFNKADTGTGILNKEIVTPKMMGEGTNRVGRIKPVDTDRGTFRFKDNRKGD